MLFGSWSWILAPFFAALLWLYMCAMIPIPISMCQLKPKILPKWMRTVYCPHAYGHLLECVCYWNLPFRCTYMYEAECISNVWNTLMYEKSNAKQTEQREDSDRHTQRERMEGKDGWKSKGERGRRRHILVYYCIEIWHMTNVDNNMK